MAQQGAMLSGLRQGSALGKSIFGGMSSGAGGGGSTASAAAAAAARAATRRSVPILCCASNWGAGGYLQLAQGGGVSGKLAIGKETREGKEAALRFDVVAEGDTL